MAVFEEIQASLRYGRMGTVDGGEVRDVVLSNVTIDRTRCPIFPRIGNRGRVMPGQPKPPVASARWSPFAR